MLRLAAAGGLSLLAPGCPRPRSVKAVPAGPPAGRIHGEDAALGHLLRDGGLAGLEPDAQEQADVLVVGAGVAGLACAWRLRRDGVTATLIDAGSAPGGNARSGQNAVSAFPWGAHYLRAPTREHRSLEVFLEDAGLIRGRDAGGQIDWDTRAVCAAPLERLFEGGLWREGLVPRGRETQAALERFDAQVTSLAALRDPDGRRAFSIPLAAGADLDQRALDASSFAAWLDAEGFTDPGLRWLLEYACRDDYGCTLQTTSAWAGLHYYCARRSEAPDRDVVLAWPEGNGRLVRLLLGEARVRTRHLCARIEPGAKGEASQADVYDAESERLVRFEAQHLVFAGPQFVLARLLPEAPAHAQAFSYAPWLVANVTLARPPGGVGAELAWDNVLRGSASLGYVVANREGPRDGPCVATWYAPRTGDPAAERRRLLAATHAELAGEVAADLRSAHPGLEIQSVDVWRWGHAMVRPTPGFLWGPERRAALQRDDALLCAHSDLSGISVFEEAFYRGVVAAEEILRRQGKAFTSLL